jgi:hypothetical protein
MILTCSSCNDNVSLDSPQADNWVSIPIQINFVIDVHRTKKLIYCKEILKDRTFLCPNCQIIKDIIE